MTLAGRVRLGAAIIGGVAWLGLFTPAFAQSRPPSSNASLAARVDALAAQVKQQEERLKIQERELAAARAALAQNQSRLQVRSSQAASAAPVTSPVGEAPRPDEQPPQVIQSLPEGLSVLTSAGHFVLTPSLEYTQTTSERLVYRGIVLVPGINIGAVDASTDDRNIFSSVADLRFGLTNRLELEVRAPFVYSDDRATILSQGPTGSATQSIYLQNSGIGDVELAGRYQLNGGTDDWPIFLGNVRVKSDTGVGPYDIKRDVAGIAQEVALGSGFWTVEGGFSMLKLTDPAVIFGSINYVHAIPKTIDKTIGGVLVGEVDPSDAIVATMGFGFAVNPELSFSLGYEHSYVMPQTTELGTTRQETTSLQVGAMTLGMAYRLSPAISLNTNFEFGVTKAAPDMRAVFSIPILL
ncbi:MAG: transporter [Alphaproteobacteria bacterium]|mgnify:CR=1 FL=1|nr:transporter [Alphaproteobacteria bacterium]